MNCNNFGNYFEVVGLERELKTNKNSYIIGNTYYPKGYCYRARLGFDSDIRIRYSEAIDRLIPEDYLSWKNNRFGE